MFRTLRAKLIASHIVIVIICLTLAGSLGLFWWQRYEREVALTRTRIAAQALSRTLQTVPAKEAQTPPLLSQFLRNEVAAAEGEVLFVNEGGTVLRANRNNGLEGQRIPLLSPRILRNQAGRWPSRHWRSRKGGSFFLVYVPLPRAPEALPTPLSQSAVRYVVLAVPAEDIQRPWKEWLPPLLGIGALALVVSTWVSFLLSRSITQPVEAMTHAAEEMASGRYAQQIAVQGQDEIGRLGSAFNRMAREVERARRTQRDFMVNISHDLQTPLTSVRGFSQAIIEGAIRDLGGLKRAGSIIYEESNRMGRLVSDLLDLARLEAGQIEVAKVPVDLAHLLQLCVEKSGLQAKEANILLSLNLPDALPTILGDSDRLSQAFANLLDNAIKYTPSGGKVALEGYVLGSSHNPRELGPEVRAKLGLPGALGKGQWIIVSVNDTGIGIPEGDLDRIFERFYRADKARADKEGIGLGLSIARQIVEVHGGRITVSSRVGEGSQFHVALPVNVDDSQ